MLRRLIACSYPMYTVSHKNVPLLFLYPERVPSATNVVLVVIKCSKIP